MKKLLFTLLVLFMIPIILSGCSQHRFKTKFKNKTDKAIYEVKTINNNSYNMYWTKNKGFYNISNKIAINNGIYPRSIIKNGKVYDPWNGTFSITNLSFLNANEYMLNMTNVPAKDCLKIGLATYKLKRVIDFQANYNILLANTSKEIKELCKILHNDGRINITWQIGVSHSQKK